ncbi:transposase domain-containing protein [Janthinobacterium sp. DSP2-3-3]|uniref:transposase domain-containing protein n=1 Tax=Janthinobacterium sp. DSP2-3-3 TaxID=2804596 RepID=UPI003CF0E2CC
MLDDTLHFLANHFEAPDWRRLGEHLQVEWIEQAIQHTDTPTQRRNEHPPRRLPAQQVVWLRAPSLAAIRKDANVSY